MSIIIPVHPMSRKILLTEHGSEPIKITSHNFLYHQLSYSRVQDATNLKHLQQVLTSQIVVVSDAKLIGHLRNELHQVGNFLYGYHKDMMTSYVLSQTELGGEAREALRKFYKTYKIEEDDYDQDSAYRYWSRFIEKKREILAQKYPKRVLFLGKHGQKNKAYGCLYSDLDLSEIHEQFMSKAHGLFTYVPVKLSKHAMLYIFHQVGKRPNKYMLDKYNLSRRTYSYGVRAMKKNLESNISLNNIMKECIDMHRVQSVAS